MIMHTAN